MPYLPRPRNLRPACFLWTACLLTWSCSAIAFHDHPWMRAFRTWSASSCSSNLLRATTALSPVFGSRLDASAASFVASLMVHQYTLTGPFCQLKLTQRVAGGWMLETSFPARESTAVAERNLPPMGHYARVTLTVVAVLAILAAAWAVRATLMLVL